MISSLLDRHCVPYWRKAYRFASIRALVVQSSLLIGWAQLPDDLKQSLPKWLLPIIAFFILVVGTLGAMYKQKGISNDKPN
jgi:hypothetical protein